MEIDEEGWVAINQLIESFRKQEEWKDVNENILHQMIKSSDKQRHELNNEKIRALYGHSIPGKILKTPLKPPKHLYHGTANENLREISLHGLMPMGRHYVHLSANVEVAITVGNRKSKKVALLKINAEEAWDKGIIFYQGNDKVWLADVVPPEYIEIL